MEQAAVAGHPAAGGANRLMDLVRELGCDRPQLALEAHVPRRAGRMEGDRPELLSDLELRQKALRPGHRVEDLELIVALAILVREDVGDLARQAEGAGARV